jgi:DNA-binding MarR family transcriptional regulator
MNAHLFELVLSIKRKCLSTEEQVQKELKLSPAEFNGLLSIKSRELVTGNMFAERMGLSPSRGSRVLWRLVSRGFIRMEVDAEDRRNIVISLTQQGKNMKKRLNQRMLKCERKIISSLPEDRVDEIKGSLSVLEKAM